MTDNDFVKWFMANRDTPFMRISDRDRMTLIMRLSVGNPDPGDIGLCKRAAILNNYYAVGGTEVDPTDDQIRDAIINHLCKSGTSK